MGDHKMNDFFDQYRLNVKSIVKTVLLVFCLILLDGREISAQSDDFSTYVDPEIGTAHSRWFFHTPAANPFGMAKPAASTDGHYGNPSGWEAVGFDPRHESIESFVNFHEFQIGGIALMATTGDLITTPGLLEEPDLGYRSRFSKDNEVARPGYYSVFLDDYEITAELTSTSRVAYHSYTFPESGRSNLLFDIGNRQGESGEVIDAFVRKVSDREIEGFVITLPEYVKFYQTGATVAMYFVAKMDKTPDSYGSFINEQANHGVESVQGKGAGMYFSFNTEDQETVTVKVGLSYTSTENARLNLETEAKGLSFEKARIQAEQKWESMLGRIAAEGGSEENKVKFYTGLYHALLGRGLANDVNGMYRKNNHAVGQISLDDDGNPLYNHYNTDAVWGAFWNLGTLWAMAYPDYLSEYLNTHLDFFEETGWLSDGLASFKYVSGVGTNFVGQFIASGYNRGIQGLDTETAWQAVRGNELGWINRPFGAGKSDVQAFLEHGYVPFEVGAQDYSGSSNRSSRFAASHTMEYSFSAYAAAQMAKSLGKSDDHDTLMDLSHGWEKLYDEETGFIRPRGLDGNFIDNFDPAEPWRGFQEGNAYQYTFYVPHDPEGLVDQIGKDVFNERLNNLFEAAEKENFSCSEEIDAFAAVGGVYNHGNQPSLHISWLFNYSDSPWLTQKWVREISDKFYGTEPIHGYGLGQDEDQGQLGAWFVLAGMGLFDVAGGSDQEPTLQMSLPMFDRIRIELHQDHYPGDEFIITVDGDPSRHNYVRSAILNGMSWDSFKFPWDTFKQGGHLHLVSSPKPVKTWGIQ
ncbi:MAG: GH92 family glycosyl hydrolase [Balneolaceae bacterium]